MTKGETHAILIERWKLPLASGLMALFIFLLFAGRKWAPGYNFFGSIAFALALTVLLYRKNLNSRFLNWCGSHLFVLYIYQRLPMLVLATCGCLSARWSLPVTCPTTKYPGSAPITRCSCACCLPCSAWYCCNTGKSRFCKRGSREGPCALPDGS